MGRALIELIERNKAIGQEWFEPTTMAYFMTHVETEPRQDRFGLGSTWWFITSEQWDLSDPSDRLYTIREENNGRIETVGGFRAYRTLEDALGALDSIIEARSLYPDGRPGDTQDEAQDQAQDHGNPLRDAELRRMSEVTDHRFDEDLYSCDWCDCYVAEGRGFYPESDLESNLRLCRACFVVWGGVVEE